MLKETFGKQKRRFYEPKYHGANHLPMRDLKKAVAKAAAQTQVNLRKAGQGLSDDSVWQGQGTDNYQHPKPLRNPAR